MLAFYLSLLDTPEEKDIFECLYRRYSKLLKHVAYQKLQDEQLAEDAVHNAFLKIIKNLCEIHSPFSHKTRRFLVIVTESVAIDMLRRQVPTTYVAFEEENPIFSVTPDMLEGIAVEELLRMITDMPEACRIVLELRVYHDLSIKQIAKMLDLSTDAVRKRLERARLWLAAAIKEREDVSYESISE